MINSVCSYKMVYNKRNNHYDTIDFYEAGCACLPKRTRKQRSRHQKSNEEMYSSKQEDSCISADIFYTRRNAKFYEGNRTNKKLSGVQKRPFNRSVQNLSSLSLADASLRCDTPLGKFNRKFCVDSTNRSIDYLKIPDSDRRILELLALKKEQERHNEQLAHQSQLLWEKSQNERIKIEQEQKEKWQKYVKEKRKSESLQNLFRMEDIKQSLRESQKQLEESLKKRDEQVAGMKKKKEEKKHLELKEKQINESLKKAIIEANFKYKEDEVEEYFQKHIEELEEKLNKAESLRRQRQQQIHRRVASANRSEGMRHQDNVLDLMIEQSHIKHHKQKQCQERESRARERQIHYRISRERSIKQLRAEQEEKAAQVREMHRELSRGLEVWQDQVMLLQWADHQRAEAAVLSQREHRRLKVEEENKERQVLHKQRMRKVKEAEFIKELNARETIIAKEHRIKLLQKQRERELNEGRAQAQLTAELRDHLRRTLSPETFDRKVARAALETRISNRTITASPSLLSSHIRLG